MSDELQQQADKVNEGRTEYARTLERAAENDTDDPYARCVVADLAAEAMDDIRQAIGDAEDAAQGIAFA